MARRFCNLSDDSGGAGDALRRYLREISGAELLTREQEVALAQRIEAGRAVLFSALCRSPIFIAEIKGWRARIMAGNLLLREIIDLAGTRRQMRGGAAAEEPEVVADDDESGGSTLARIEEELTPTVLAAFNRVVRRPAKAEAALQPIVLDGLAIDRLAARLRDVSRRLAEGEGRLARVAELRGRACRLHQQLYPVRNRRPRGRRSRAAAGRRAGRGCGARLPIPSRPRSARSPSCSARPDRPGLRSAR